jgi:hypothetical protein
MIAVQRAVAVMQRQVLGHTQSIEHHAFLRRVAHALPCAAMGRREGQIGPLEHHPARCRSKRASDKPYQRRFADAVASGHAQRLALRQAERQAGDDDDLAISAGKIFDREKRRDAHLLPPE